MRDERFKLITIESDFGAGKQGAAQGPGALINELKSRNFNFIELNNPIQIHPLPSSEDGITPFGKHIAENRKLQETICTAIETILSNNSIPFILSGDHSNANGTISGVKNYFSDKRIGVIWIDAHADIHSPYTTPSGNMHGMPLAALLGINNVLVQKNNPKEISKMEWENLKQVGSKKIEPKILPSDLVYIALRSTEEEEENIIAKQNIKAIRPEEIASLGIAQVLTQTLQYLSACDLIYVSFDVDSIDSSLSRGTGTPAENGLTYNEAKYILQTVSKLNNLAGIEITEINPLLDEEKPMQKLIANLLAEALQ